MPIIIEDLPEISAKIQELEHIQHKSKGKTYHAYIVHIQIPGLNIKYNDFSVTISDELIIELNNILPEGNIKIRQ